MCSSDHNYHGFTIQSETSADSGVTVSTGEEINNFIKYCEWGLISYGTIN